MVHEWIAKMCSHPAVRSHCALHSATPSAPTDVTLLPMLNGKGCSAWTSTRLVVCVAQSASPVFGALTGTGSVYLHTNSSSSSSAKRRASDAGGGGGDGGSCAMVESRYVPLLASSPKRRPESAKGPLLLQSTKLSAIVET